MPRRGRRRAVVVAASWDVVVVVVMPRGGEECWSGVGRLGCAKSDANGSVDLAKLSLAPSGILSTPP